MGAANAVAATSVGIAPVGILISCMWCPGINTTLLIDVWWGGTKTWFV